MKSEEKFLSNLESHWHRLKIQAHAVSFRKGQILFYEGHWPYGLFLLIRGELTFKHRGKICTKKHFWNFQEYQILCLDSFIKKDLYSCNALLLSDSDFIFFSKLDLTAELKEQKQSSSLISNHCIEELKF